MTATASRATPVPSSLAASAKFKTFATAFSISGMTMSYFAAAPIFKRMTRRDLLSPAAVATRRRSLLDFLNHGLHPETECAR